MGFGETDWVSNIFSRNDILPIDVFQQQSLKIFTNFIFVVKNGNVYIIYGSEKRDNRERPIQFKSLILDNYGKTNEMSKM
jgi:hypothetical protein